MERSGNTLFFVAHEGRKLRQLLDQHGKTVADLSRASGKSAQAIYKWLEQEVFGARAWVTIRRAMRDIGLDSRLIGHRADDEDDEDTAPAAVVGSGAVDSLLSQVLALPLDQLALLRNVLEQPESVRRQIQISLNAIIHRHHLETGSVIDSDGLRYDDDDEDPASGRPRTSRPSSAK